MPDLVSRSLGCDACHNQKKSELTAAMLVIQTQCMRKDDDNPFKGKSDAQIARIGYAEAASFLRWVAQELSPGTIRAQLLRRARALECDARAVREK